MSKKNKSKQKVKVAQNSNSNSDIFKTYILPIIIAIITICISKGFDYLFPTKVSLKEVPVEKVVVEHSFDFGNNVDDSLINQRLINIAQIEALDEKIEEDKRSNTINLGNLCPNAKGYTIGNSSPFCTVELNNSSNGIIEIHENFFEQSIIEQISFVGIKVERVNADNSISMVFDSNYYPKKNNIIRISNNFPSGDFNFHIGFTLKEDTNKEYPKFYQQTIRLSIK